MDSISKCGEFIGRSYIEETTQQMIKAKCDYEKFLTKRTFEIFYASSTPQEALKRVQELYDKYQIRATYNIVSTNRLLIYFNAFKSENLTPDCSMMDVLQAAEKYRDFAQMLRRQRKFVSVQEFHAIYSNLDEMIVDSEFDTLIMPRSVWRELYKLNPTRLADYKIYNEDVADDTPIVRCKLCGCEIFKTIDFIYGDEHNMLHSVNKKRELVCKGCDKIIRDLEEK